MYETSVASQPKPVTPTHSSSKTAAPDENTLQVLAAARSYINNGLSVIPIRADGSKAPALSWKEFQSRRMTPNEITANFSNGGGIAVVGGAISGNLEILDIDAPELNDAFFDACRDHGVETDHLPLTETPSGARHLYYRCEETITGNIPTLARRASIVPDNTPKSRLINGQWVKVEPLIETRGEGGYALVYPSPAACHEANKPYRMLRGCLADIPVISGEHRDALHTIASLFNEYIEPEAMCGHTSRKASESGALRPGDDYNERGDYESELEAAGWSIVGTRGDQKIWRRPGKSGRGISATSNFEGKGLFYAFTSNAHPFETTKPYSPFGVYTALRHDGDFKAAARELGKQGYGDQSKSKAARINKSDGEESGKAPKKSQADTLIEIGLGGELFRTPNDEAHITITRDNHAETHRLKSSGFRDYLKSRHFKETGKTPSAQATQDALDTLAGFAYEAGTRHEIYLRVAPVNGPDGTLETIYLDLGDDKWRAVEITANGWQIVENAPVKFVRPRGILALPDPQRGGGNINQLRPYVNIGSDEDFVLFVCWQLAAFQPTGVLPILQINGPQGSAKTSTQKNARQLLDPSSTPTRAMPRNQRDLMIAAKNSPTGSYDNVSAVEDWLSDALCSLSSGAGFATRELHSDGEETLITAKRRVMLNGITGTGSRADFLDRCIILSLPRITEKKRRVESEIEAGFAAAHGAILGAILDAVSVGIRELPHTNLAQLPRMADFAKWATACETGFGWDAGTFQKAYAANLKEGVEVAADASPIVAALRSFIAKNRDFEGTTRTLSKAINDHVGEETHKQKGFPSGPQALGHALKRAVTILHNVGIEATSVKKENGNVWTIKITNSDDPNDKAPNPDDVPDDVRIPDDVKATSSGTSSAENTKQGKGLQPENAKPDDADDVDPHLSCLPSPAFFRSKKAKTAETVQTSAKDNTGFTSSTSSASSAATHDTAVGREKVSI